MPEQGLVRQLALIIACLLAILAPVPFGATHPMVIVTIALALAAALVLLWADREVVARPPARFAWLVMATLALAVFQLVPMPPTVVDWLSPRLAAEARQSLAFEGADPGLSATETAIAEIAGGTRPEPGWRPLSVDPDGGLDGTARLAVLLAAFCVGLLAVRNSSQRRLLVGAVALSAFFQATYGLAESLSGHHHILNYARTHYLPLASGTFICPNHFAALLSLGLFSLLGLLTELWLHGKDTASDRTAKTALAATAAGVIVVAMIWASSRAGLGAAAAGLAFFAVLALTRLSGRHSRLAGGAIIGGLLVTLVAGAIWIRPPEPLANDVENMAMDLGGRAQIWQSTTGMIKAFPLVGSGVGTYRYVHPFFRHAEIGTRTLHSHNDYYEWISDTGLLGAPLLLAWIVLLIFGGIVAARRQRGLVLTLALGSGLLALALHEIVDFSLQLPGVSVPAGLLAGAWLAPLAWGPQRRTSRDPRAWGRASLVAAGLLLVASALILWNLRPLPARPDGPLRLAAESGHLRSWARGLVGTTVEQVRAGRVTADQDPGQTLGAAVVSLQKACQRSPLRGDLRLSLWLASQSLIALDPSRPDLPRELIPLTSYYLHRAEELAPFDRQRQLKLIRTWVSAGHPEEARRVSRKLLDMQPYEAATAYDLLGGDGLGLSDLMEATPNTPEAAYRLSHYLASQRRDQSGSQIVLERALARHPEDWRLRIRTAQRLIARGRYAQAGAALEGGDQSTLVDKIEQRDFLAARAHVLSGLGEIAQLQSILPRLNESGLPASQLAYLEGRALMTAGREPEAAEAFTKALDPRLPPLRDHQQLVALLALARFHETGGQPGQVLEYYERARALRPDHPQVLRFFNSLKKTQERYGSR